MAVESPSPGISSASSSRISPHGAAPWMSCGRPGSS